MLLLLLSRFSRVRLLRPHRWQPTRLPSLGLSRQEHWSGWPGIGAGSPALQADSLPAERQRKCPTSRGERSVSRDFCHLRLLTPDSKLDSGSWFLPWHMPCTCPGRGRGEGSDLSGACVLRGTETMKESRRWFGIMRASVGK